MYAIIVCAVVGFSVFVLDCIFGFIKRPSDSRVTELNDTTDENQNDKPNAENDKENDKENDEEINQTD